MQKGIEIVKADINDKEFILFANEEISKSSGLNDSTLHTRIDEEIFGTNPKSECLVVKDGEKNIGMCIYSKIYWTNVGEGIYISQVYVVPEYRKKGIFRRIVEYIKENNKDNIFLTCLVGEENSNMNDALRKTGWKRSSMVTHFLKNDKSTSN